MAKPRLVAIDDEVEFIDMIKSYFEPRGYDITVATRGTSGIAERRQIVFFWRLKRWIGFCDIRNFPEISSLKRDAYVTGDFASLSRSTFLDFSGEAGLKVIFRNVAILQMPLISLHGTTSFLQSLIFICPNFSGRWNS